MPRNLLSELTLKKTSSQPSSHALTCALKPNSKCCQGHGFINATEGPFAKLKLCDCIKNCTLCLGSAKKPGSNNSLISCNPVSPTNVINLFNDAQIPARYSDVNLKTFANRTGNTEKIISQVEHWLKEYRTSKSKGFIISGSVGLGKTFILTSIAKELIFKGIKTRFIDFFQLLGQLRAAYGREESDLQILTPLISADVLVIDELGKGRNTDWELTVLDQLVMGRYNQNKAIIASTNCILRTKKDSMQLSYNVDLERDLNQSKQTFDPDYTESLEARVGPRIFSRLQEMCLFWEMTGENYRKRKQY